MTKLIKNVRSFLFLGLGLISFVGLPSCSKDEGKSLSELKEEQSDAIASFKANRQLSFIELKGNELPSIIDKNVYYRMKNGLYIRVIDAGDTSKWAEEDKSIIFATFKGHQFTKFASLTARFDNLSQAHIPELEFRYVNYYNGGEIHHAIISNTRPLVNYDSFMCEGIAFPLSLKGVIGNGARLSLIIPFDLGPSSSYSSGATTFIEEIRYILR